MKRDMDLVREILLRVEAADTVRGWVPLDISGQTAEAVSYHVKLLAQAGLLEANDVSTMQAFCWKAQRLTWDGHEFLDAARNDSLWSKAKAMILERGGSLTLDALKAALAALLKSQIGI